MYSDSSEYNDETEENEINLYSQVYFESETHTDMHLKPDSKSNNSINAVVKNCNPTQNIENEHQNKNSIPNNTEESSKRSLYLKETSDAADSKKSHSTLKANSGNLFKKRHLNSKGKMEVRIPPPCRQRERKSSICSLDSISGKEPLDSLYCDGVSDEEINLSIIAEEDFEDQECNVPLKRKKISQETSPKEEVTILPTPIPVTPPLEVLDSSSDESIKILGYTKKSNSSLVEPKMGKLQFAAYSSSESDDLDLSPVKNISFAFNLDLDTSSSVLPNGSRVRDKRLEFIKSQVIFSKGRPLSKRHPTCPKWTPDMTSLYDSDYFEEFSVQDVHKTQTDSPNYWTICKEDDPAFRRSLRRNRYFQRRCRRCKEEDHEVENCPRVAHCLFCASPTHLKFDCPKNCCFKCGKKPHRYCFLTPKQICGCCKSNGHDSNICPDLWRRYHITVAGSVPIASDNSSATNSHPPYCYNCGKKGHYGHQCPEQNFRYYTPVTTLIQSYCKPNSTELSKTFNQSPKKMRRSIYTNAHHLKQIAGNQNNGLNQIRKRSETTITPTYKGKDSKMRRSIYTSVHHLKQIAGNQNNGLNQIMKRSETTITPTYKRKDSKLTVEGPIKNVKYAFQLLSKEFSKTGKTLKMPPSFRAQGNNLSSDEKCEFDSSIPLVIFPKSLSKETKIIKRFPLSLPSKRKQALQAISIILKPLKSLFSPNSKLLTLQNIVIKYFEACDISNPQSAEDFSSYIHLLTSITNRNSKSLKCITKDLWKIKNTLEVYRNEQLDPVLYRRASSIYTSMVDPPSKTILKMLCSLNK